MKLQSVYKIFAVICFSFLLSCSSDGDSSSSLVLIKKVTTVGEESENVELIYQNNILKKGISGNGYTEFLYTGNKVTSMKRYVNNDLIKTNSFVYTGDLLTSITSDGTYPERTAFYYVNNELSSIEYQYLSGTEWVMIEKNEYQFDSNSNVIQLENMWDAGTQVFTNRRENYFDNKNNPTKDMNPYVRLFIDFINIDEKSSNNVVSYDYFSPSNSTTSSTYTYQTIYNENDFPTQIKRFSPEGDLLTTTTIEYQ